MTESMRHRLLSFVVLIGCAREQQPAPAQQTPAEQTSPASVVIENAVRMEVPADQETGQLSAPSLPGVVFRVDAMTDDGVSVVQAVERPAAFPGTSKLLMLYVNGQ